ncbi:PH domain-containing protein [Microbacterium rhizosphaerae]|uniref:PH domain-containing protein n=1 Tax=Microbacterium rhizosphaerae TaxID=1678237 RepID=A0ABZ0SU74_9MICO|nr:PH domain-containing protein [Microbacterium rhizosphaerae]WPR90802.1 PH domain-containing protein [Microbacterium rhizosphaerae]
MTQPSIGGRPLTPAPGIPTPELRVARFRGHARRLTWSALVLIVTAGALGYFYGRLPAPFTNWMLVGAAVAIVLLLVLIPFLVWWGRVYTITTRRVIARGGIGGGGTRELSHVRGYTIDMRRGPIQRMWGTGTLTLRNGIDEPLRLVDIPSAVLVHEVLVDQVEVNQILAHRELPLPGTAQGVSGMVPPNPPPPLPPRPA